MEGFQEEWLHYRRADQERDIREDQKRVEQARKRLSTLDVVMSRLYEDYALSEISKEKYKKMTADYEAEQERLKLEIETTEEWVEQRQAMGDDLDAFIALTKKYVDVTELTQTIVNEYIKKVIIHAPDKSCGWGRERCDREGHAVFLCPRVDSAIMGSASTGISTSSTKLKMISTFCRRLPPDLSGA